MIGFPTIFAVCVTLILTLFLPIVLMILFALKCKCKGLWATFGLGAAGFVVMQMVLRVPVLNILSLQPGFTTFAMEHYVLYSFILAFTAALFEVIGRYIVARIIKSKLQLSAQKGVVAGLGHGGIESMLLIGMTYVSNLLYIFMINSGTFDVIVEQQAAIGLNVSSLLAVKESLISSPAILFYLAGYERILTIIVHVALSLLVCYTVWQGCAKKGILISLGFHWLLDFVGPLLSALATPYLGNRTSQGIAYSLTYVFLTIMAGVAVYMIFSIYKKWDGRSQNCQEAADIDADILVKEE